MLIMISNLANLITCFRMVLAPVCCVFIINGLPVYACAVFIFASVTDGLDGYIARRYQQISVFGRVMDPLADKCLTLMVSLSLLWMYYSMELALILLLMAVRELLVTYFRSRFSQSGVFTVTFIAKLKTTIQMIGLALFMLMPLHPYFGSIGMLTLNVSLILAWWSFREYMKKLRDHLTISQPQ